MYEISFIPCLPHLQEVNSLAHRLWRAALTAGLGLALVAWTAGPLMAQSTPTGSGAGSTSLYPSTPIFSDTFSSGTLAPFVSNNGLSPGGTWSITSNGLSATDYGSTAPLQNQIATVPNMPTNVVLDTTFTINQVNTSQYYRIGLLAHGSAPHTGASQWAMVLDRGNLEIIDQGVNYPASLPFAIQSGQSYQMMMVVDGTWIGGKVWQVGTTEPTQWSITGVVEPNSFTSVGVAGANADVTFQNFAVYPAPPILTVTPNSTSAVFSGRGPASYTATLKASDSSESGQYYVNYLLTGLNGSTVTQGQVPIDLPAGGSAQATLTMPHLPYGYYNVSYSLTNERTSLQYEPEFPGHSSEPSRSKTPPIGLTPPPGHTLTFLPSTPGQRAIPPQDLAQSTSPAPVENSTTSLATVPVAANLNTLDPSSPFGINGQGNRLGVITPAKEGALVTDDTLFKSQGIEWIRTEFMWNYVEPNPGIYTWNNDDGLVEAAHTAHENLLGLLDYWGNYANPFLANSKVSFATAVQEYDQYVQSVVRRYMPGGTLAQQMDWKHYGITAWEVWNEPSTRAFWLSQNPTEYAQLVKSAAAAIKAVEPNATILAYHWHQNTLVNVAGTGSFTGMSIHDYPGPVRPSATEFYDGVEQLRQFFTENGIGNDPIWMTESGWSSNSVTQTQQAQYLAQAEIESLAGSLNKFFMFSWNYPGSGYGELNGALLPKPAYPALAAASDELTGYTPAASVNPINMGSAIRAFAFQNGSSSLVAVWSTTGNGTLTVHRGDVQAFDWMGNSIFPQGPSLTVPLNESPVYLVAHTSPANLAAMVQNGTVSGIAPVAITIQNLPNSPSTLPNLTLTVTDQINTPQSGTLTVNLPSGWEASSSTTTAATYTPSVSFGPLAASATTTESFNLDQFQANPTNQYVISATASLASNSESHGPGQRPAPPSGSASVTPTVTTSLPVSTYETVYGTPPLTGTFQNWGNAVPLQVNQSNQNVGIPNWSPSVESATAYTMWNAKYFYFAAKVTDSVFYEPYTGFDQWEGDSIQIFWDPQNTKTTSYDAAAGDANFGIAKTPAGSQAYEFDGSAPGLHSDVKMTIVPGPSGGDMWYEAAIPMVDLPGLTATNGHPYGFDFLVNDNNGTGRLGWIWLTPGVGNGFTPSDFPTFTLVNSATLGATRIDAAETQGTLTFTPNAKGALLSVNDNGVGPMTVTLSDGTTLTLTPTSSASANVTPTGSNPTVPILANGTTTINLASYVTPSTAISLNVSASPTGSASAIVAVDNGVQ